MRIYTGQLTMDERLFIHCYYIYQSKQEIADYLDISHSIVKTYCTNRKLKISYKQRAAILSRSSQKSNNSGQFDEFIKANYLKMNFNQLAQKIKKSDTFVRNRIAFL